MNHRSVIYVTYDGLTDPLGQSQVLPYIRGLAASGHRFDVISFEKPRAKLVINEELAPNIRWTSLRYHRSPTVPATAYDMLNGLRTMFTQHAKRKADLVHVRSYVAATLAMPFVRAMSVPLLFDTRGTWPDEKVESGTWPANGALYSAAKAVEHAIFRQADCVTVLTNAFQYYLRSTYPDRHDISAPIHVIPTCVDLATFRPDVEPNASISAETRGTRPLIYAGSLGGFYLSEAMAQFYLAWRQCVGPTRFIVLSQGDPSTLRRVLEQAGVGHELICRRAVRSEVPTMLRCAVAGVGLDARGFAGVATAPTKLGEGLACGLPMAVTSVGDIPYVAEGNDVTIVLSSPERSEIDRGAAQLAAVAMSAGVAQRARRVAETWFDLDRGVAAYDNVYASIPDKRHEAPLARDAHWPP